MTIWRQWHCLLESNMLFNLYQVQSPTEQRSSSIHLAFNICFSTKPDPGKHKLSLKETIWSKWVVWPSCYGVWLLIGGLNTRREFESRQDPQCFWEQDTIFTFTQYWFAGRDESLIKKSRTASLKSKRCLA